MAKVLMHHNSNYNFQVLIIDSDTINMNTCFFINDFCNFLNYKSIFICLSSICQFSFFFRKKNKKVRKKNIKKNIESFIILGDKRKIHRSHICCLKFKKKKISIKNQKVNYSDFDYTFFRKLNNFKRSYS